MKKANCSGLLLDDTSITTINDIITPIEAQNPIDYVLPNCGGIKFNKDYFQVIKGVVTVIEAQDAEIEPMTVLGDGCGGLRVDGKYFKYDSKFGLSVDWDLVPNTRKKRKKSK